MLSNSRFCSFRDGKQVAIMQDHTIEVRSDRDDFGAPIGKWTIAKDTHPQWRRLVWSTEGDILASSSSAGKVDLYDVVGTPIGTIQVIGHDCCPALIYTSKYINCLQLWDCTVSL